MGDFDSTWKILQILDRLQGSYVINEANQKLIILQRIYQWMWMLVMLLLITSTMIVNRSDLSLALQCAIMLQMYVSAFSMNAVMMTHKKRVTKVLLWCKETQALDNVHMNEARILVGKTVRRFVIYFGFSCFSVTIAMIIIGQLLPDEIYPKFRPPQPFVLPLEDQDNWKIYIITCVMQFFGVLYVQLLPCSYYSFFSTFGIIFYAYLNTLLDDINEVNEMSKTWTNKLGISSKQGDLEFKVRMNRIAEKYCEGLE